MRLDEIPDYGIDGYDPATRMFICVHCGADSLIEDWKYTGQGNTRFQYKSSIEDGKIVLSKVSSITMVGGTFHMECPKCGFVETVVPSLLEVIELK